jgi:hypothetical protein
MYSAVLRQFHRTRQRPLPPLSNAYLVSPLIAELCENWHQLHDIERALDVREIIQLGVSRRRLAQEIGFSEGLLRHLLKTLEATPSDIELAGKNAISTNELVRRTKPGYIPSTKPTQAVGATPVPDHVDLRPAYDARGGSAVILDWLWQDPVRSSWACEILEEALNVLNRAAEKGKLPRDRAPEELSVVQIIRRCRPDPNRFDLHVAMHAHWLALWVFYLIPDPSVCMDAMNMALDRAQMAGGSPNL